jgi:hypothetical protein
MAAGYTLTEKDMNRLEKDFTYHPAKPGQAERYDEILLAGKGFAALILFACPDSRERSLALTKIEEAVGHANNSISRNE